MSRTKAKFQLRAQSTFARSVKETGTAIDAMIADHAAKGCLQSGATIKVALKLFEEHSSRALDQALAETAKLIEHRQSRWTAAMDGIREALDAHLAAAPSHLTKARRLADSNNSPSVTGAIETRLSALHGRLHAQLAEFRDGWTAPAPKPWRDRHPLFVKIALLVIAALIALALSYATGLLNLGSANGPSIL